MEDSIAKVGIVKAATENRIGASLSIQHRTINNRTINGEQLPPVMHAMSVSLRDDLSTRASRLPTSSKSITFQFAPWPTGTSSARYFAVGARSLRGVQQGDAVRKPHHSLPG
jgi:hypothetical protein